MANQTLRPGYGRSLQEHNLHAHQRGDEFPGEAEIPVLESNRIREAVLRDFIVFELLISPVIQALYSHDRRIMGRLLAGGKGVCSLQAQSTITGS
jgi:hypothetical protein